MYKMPKIMGVLNITPDSFSDGGKYFCKDDAILGAKKLIADGAEILDIGAETTRTTQRPHENIHHKIPERKLTSLISSEEEWRRLSNILPEIIAIAKEAKVKISIDTRHIETLRNIIAHNYEIDLINDVTGGADIEMLKLIASKKYQIVLMHNLGIPANPQNVLPSNQDVLEIVKLWLEERIKLCLSLGINKEKIIIDPGIGFGKTAEQSLELLKNIAQFKKLGVKILVGHSRKSFFNLFTSKSYSERDIETFAASLFLATQEVDYLRVHEVAGNIRVLKVGAGLF